MQLSAAHGTAFRRSPALCKAKRLYDRNRAKQEDRRDEDR